MNSFGLKKLGDCTHEIKRHLLLGRKATTNLDSIFKSRHITLPTKVRLVKAMVFSVVMYGCESWTIKKAERRRIDAFEVWCWSRFLRVPLGCKEIQPVHHKGNQSWIFIGRTDGETETPILWPPDAKNRLTGKDPEAGKDWRREEKGTTEDEMVGWTWVWASSRSWWWTGRPGVLRFTGLQRVRNDWATELTDWLRGEPHMDSPVQCDYLGRIRDFDHAIWACPSAADQEGQCAPWTLLRQLWGKTGC